MSIDLDILRVALGAVRPVAKEFEFWPAIELGGYAVIIELKRNRLHAKGRLKETIETVEAAESQAWAAWRIKGRRGLKARNGTRLTRSSRSAFLAANRLAYAIVAAAKDQDMWWGIFDAVGDSAYSRGRDHVEGRRFSAAATHWLDSEYYEPYRAWQAAHSGAGPIMDAPDTPARRQMCALTRLV